MGKGTRGSAVLGGNPSVKRPALPLRVNKGRFQGLRPDDLFTWMVQSSDGPGLRVGPGP